MEKMKSFQWNKNYCSQIQQLSSDKMLLDVSMKVNKKKVVTNWKIKSVIMDVKHEKRREVTVVAKYWRNKSKLNFYSLFINFRLLGN